MKKLFCLLACLPILGFGAANDIKVSQNVSGSAFTDKIFAGQSAIGTTLASYLSAVGLGSEDVPTFAGIAGAGANPSASIGLTAINGSATTFMRSDASPAIDQSIAPTWTGIHLFSNKITETVSTTGTSGAQEAFKATNNLTAASNSTAINWAIEGISQTTSGSSVDYTLATGGGGIRGVSGFGNHQGTGTVARIVGVQGSAQNIAPGASGTVTDAISVFASGPSLATGKTTTNHYGIRVQASSVSGTLGTFYGAYIEENTSGSSNYGLYVLPEVNYLKGKLLVGSSTDHAAEKFQVTGDSYFSGNVTTGSGKINKTTADTATSLTLDSTHDYVTLSNASAVTVNLPALASNLGRVYHLKNVGAGAVTIDANSTETLFSSSAVTTFVLNTGDAVTITAFPLWWAIY